MMPHLSATNPTIFETTIYEIRVKSHLDARRLMMFDDITIRHQPNGESLIIGSLTDQAALYGLLNRLRDLGITLVSVNPIEADRS